MIVEKAKRYFMPVGKEVLYSSTGVCNFHPKMALKFDDYVSQIVDTGEDNKLYVVEGDNLHILKELDRTPEYWGLSLMSKSCCGGGQSTGFRWDAAKKQWACPDCGKTTLTANSDQDDQKYWFGRSKILDDITKCECGSEKVGSDRHSSWCPKYTP